MSAHIPADLIKRVRERAGEICEYCLLPQAWQEARFHIDHIRPRAANGQTILNNLALACVTCSLKNPQRRMASIPNPRNLFCFLTPELMIGPPISGGEKMAVLLGKR